MMKNIEDNRNNLKIPYSQIKRINIVNMTKLPKANLETQCNSHAYIKDIFQTIRTIILKLYGTTKDPE